MTGGQLILGFSDRGSLNPGVTVSSDTGLNPDSTIHPPSRIRSGFRWIQLDFVGVWPQLSAYANA